MPVFGKSLFETVLDGLDQQAGGEEDAAPTPVRGFNGGFVGRDWSAKPDAELDPSLLFDGYPPEPVADEPIIPEWLGRLSEAEIADDLALKDWHAEPDLRERRRLFALQNHPDRVAPPYRDQANRRMMVANRLVDTALAKFR